jgi:hypothetical protein
VVVVVVWGLLVGLVVVGVVVVVVVVQVLKVVLMRSMKNENPHTATLIFMLRRFV